MSAARRDLGDTGLQVHPLCLGGNVFGWTADEDASFAVLDAYAEGGGNFLDTANAYSSWAPGNRGGESETIIGRWLRSRGVRSQMVVATKVGAALDGSGQPGGLRPDLLRAGLDASRERLGVERVDLYYAHYDDPDTPLDETLGGFDDLVREGAVSAIGASNHEAARLDAALRLSRERGWARYAVLQTAYNLMDRAGYESELEGLGQEEGLGVATYFALARGFLSGKYRPGQPLPGSARAQGVAASYLNDRGARVLEALDTVAGGHGATPAQVSLAWLMARPSVTAPIASATSAEQVRELLGAAELSLSPADVELFEEASGGS